MMKEERKEYMKAYYQAHKEAFKEKCREANKEKCRAYYQAHKDSEKEKKQADLNSLGQTKNSIRLKSLSILNKSGTKIPGYEIHHCFGYDDPNKFIYCSKELHLKIHQFLRDNNIMADSDHYEQIKHLLDDSVFLYNI